MVHQPRLDCGFKGDDCISAGLGGHLYDETWEWGGVSSSSVSGVLTFNQDETEVMPSCRGHIDISIAFSR